MDTSAVVFAVSKSSSLKGNKSILWDTRKAGRPKAAACSLSATWTSVRTNYRAVRTDTHKEKPHYSASGPWVG